MRRILLPKNQTMLTQEKTIAFSGNVPVNYDTYLGPMFFEPFAQDMVTRINRIKPKNLLELASGTGRLTKLLPSAIANGGSVIASDINPDMIAFGKSKIRHDAPVTWQQVDAVTLPFANESFDCVAVQFGVMFYSDRVKAFKEAFRVLRKGGTFIFNCWDEISNNPLPNITNEVLHEFIPVDTPAFYSIPFSYYDEALITTELAEAGFSKPDIKLLKLVGYIKSAKEATKGLLFGTPTSVAIEDRDPEKLPLIVSEIEHRIGEYLGNAAGQVDHIVPLQARVISVKK